MPKPIVISILADAAGVGKGVGEAEGFLGRLGGKVGAVAKAVGVATVAAGVAVAGISLSSASEAQQSIGATQSVFAEYADSVIDKSNQAANAVGLSANSYREMSTVLGSMLKNAGTPLDQLGTKTDTLIGLGADLAATFGGPTSDAVSAISSLLRGEADPIERYGVSIKQSDVNARLAAEGLTGLTGEALKAAEGQARLGLLFEQTSSAQGQFGKETDTLAGQQQRLGATVDNLQAALGTRLLPVATSLVGFLNANAPAAFDFVSGALDRLGPLVDAASTGLMNMGAVVGPALAAAVPYIVMAAQAVGGFAADLLQRLWPAAQTVIGFLADVAPPAFNGLVTAGQTLQPVVSGVAGVLLDAASAVSGLIGFMDQNRVVVGVLVGGYVAYRAILVGTAVAGWAVYLWQSRAVIMGAAQIAVTTGMTAAQTALNIAMRANPLGLIIAGLTLLVAGIVYAWKNSETFRDVVTGAFGAVVSAGQAVWDGITVGLQFVQDAFGVAVNLIQGYVGLWVSGFMLVVDGAVALYNGVAGAVGLVVDGVGLYVNLVQGYIGLWVGAFQGLVDKALGIPGAIGGAIGSAVGAILGFKDSAIGALKDAGTWLLGVGGDVVSGIGQGIRDKAGDVVKGAIDFVSDKIPGWAKSALGIASPSKVMRDQVGRWIPLGIAAGIEAEQATLNRAVVDSANRAVQLSRSTMSTGLLEAPDWTVAAESAKAKANLSPRWDDLAMEAALGGTTVNHYTIRVEAVAPNAEVGRAVVKAIKDYERTGGTRP